MTNSTLLDKSQLAELDAGSDSLPIFLNWPVEYDRAEVGDLLDGTDFGSHKLAFFNPLQFAIDHGFWSAGRDISEVTYTSLDDKDFLRYLSRARRVSKTIKEFLDNGGLLVIRSNIPKAHIKVRKRSSASTMKYTESLISTFFWLEEILGVCSFTYSTAQTLKFRVTKNPLARIFNKTGVESVQTVNSVGNGKLDIIAGSGSSPKAAALSRVTFDSVPGQIFLIPRFRVGGETEKLIEAFSEIQANRRSGSRRPTWLGYYENQVRDFSPWRPMLDEVEVQIQALKKQLATLERSQQRYEELVGLLFESEDELVSATRTALSILGLTCLELPPGNRKGCLEAHPKADPSERLVIRATFTDTGPIRPSEVEALEEALQTRSSTLKAKGILLGSAGRYVRPEHRQPWFDDGCLDMAKRLDYCLLPTLELFTITCYVMTRSKADNLEAIKSSLLRDLTACDTVFSLDRKKYAI